MAASLKDVFAGACDQDTNLQAAAREAGWALMELVDSIAWEKRGQVADIAARLGHALMNDISVPPTSAQWLPIAQADTNIAYVHVLGVSGELRIGNSYPVWVRDEDGRVYQALWSEGGQKAYWWDIEGESPVDPVEFMPHPLDAEVAGLSEKAGA